MAVSLTTMLAIIGTSFVLVTRIESRSTKNYSDTLTIDTVKARVLNDISERLREDVVRTETNGSDDTIVKFLNPAGTSGQTIAASPQNELNEAYDAPYFGQLAADNNITQGDIWLASTEPIDNDSANQWTEPWWPHVSDPYNRTANDSPPQKAVIWNSAEAAADGMPADADGDGITDSVWRMPPSLQIPGKDVYVALRIIDNCGLMNVNTAWDMVPSSAGEVFDDVNPNGVFDVYDGNENDQFTDVNGNGRHDGPVFGVLPTQLNASMLLAKAKRWSASPSSNSETLALQWLRVNGVVADKSLYGDYTSMDRPNDFAAWGKYVNVMNSYSDWVYRFFESPGLLASKLPAANPNTGAFSSKAWPEGWPAPLDLGKYASLFEMNDELAMRHRYLLKSDSTARIESGDRVNVPKNRTNNYSQALWNSIGDDPGNLSNIRRRTPYRDPSTAAGELAAWSRAVVADMTDFISGVTSTDYDVRHLLTTYSYDRTSPPVTMNPKVAASGLDINPGRFRSGDWNRAIEDIFLFCTDVTTPTSVARVRAARLKIVYAMKACGLSTNEAVQYLANLEDYLDADYGADLTQSDLTMFVPNALAQGIPSKTIYGLERQPFITEVYVKLKLNAQDEYEIDEFKVELFNPYPQLINLAGWQLRYAQSGTPLTVDLAGDVPAYTFTDVSTDKKNAGRTVVSCDNFKGIHIPAPTSADLQLVRAVTANATPDASAVIVDRVDGNDLEKLTEDPAQSDPNAGNPTSYERTIQRGGQYRAGGPGGAEPVAGADTWAFARNVFGEPVGSGTAGFAPSLGTSPKPSGPASQQYGYAFDTRNIAVRGTVPPKITWRDVLHPMFVGNTTEGVSDDTITDLIAKENAESKLRIDVTGDKGRNLLQWTAILSRCDDGWNNDNDDRSNDSNIDYNALAAGYVLPRCIYEADPADSAKVIANPEYRADKLSECRIPGRINVNTAPWAVLRTVIPNLYMAGFRMADHSDYAAYADEFASWVVNDRMVNGPYRSLANFQRRLNSYVKPATVEPLTKQNVSSYFRLNRWMTIWSMARQGKQYDSTVDVDMDMGTAGLIDNYEERDYLFAQMANVLTVRSDTFTAYILIRTQAESGDGISSTFSISDKRYIAIFDRSNVFLPQELAKNVNNATDPTDSKNESGDVLPVEITVDYACDPSQNPDISQQPQCFDAAKVLKTYDPNFRDRKYVEPKLVVLQEVTN